MKKRKKKKLKAQHYRPVYTVGLERSRLPEAALKADADKKNGHTKIQLDEQEQVTKKTKESS